MMSSRLNTNIIYILVLLLYPPIISCISEFRPSDFNHRDISLYLFIPFTLALLISSLVTAVMFSNRMQLPSRQRGDDDNSRSETLSTNLHDFFVNIKNVVKTLGKQSTTGSVTCNPLTGEINPPTGTNPQSLKTPSIRSEKNETQEEKEMTHSTQHQDVSKKAKPPTPEKEEVSVHDNHTYESLTEVMRDNLSCRTQQSTVSEEPTKKLSPSGTHSKSVDPNNPDQTLEDIMAGGTVAVILVAKSSNSEITMNQNTTKESQNKLLLGLPEKTKLGLGKVETKDQPINKIGVVKEGGKTKEVEVPKKELKIDGAIKWPTKKPQCETKETKEAPATEFMTIKEPTIKVAPPVKQKEQAAAPKKNVQIATAPVSVARDSSVTSNVGGHSQASTVIPSESLIRCGDVTSNTSVGINNRIVDLQFKGPSDERLKRVTVGKTKQAGTKQQSTVKSVVTEHEEKTDAYEAVKIAKSEIADKKIVSVPKVQKREQPKFIVDPHKTEPIPPKPRLLGDLAKMLHENDKPSEIKPIAAFKHAQKAKNEPKKTVPPKAPVQKSSPNASPVKAKFTKLKKVTPVKKGKK